MSKSHQTPPSWLAGFTLALLTLSVMLAISSAWYYHDKIYPNVTIDGVHVGGLTIAQANQELKPSAPSLPETTIVFSVGDTEIASTSTQLAFQPDYPQTIARAYEVGRLGSPLHRARELFLLSTTTQHLSSTLTASPKQLQAALEALAAATDIPGEQPSVELGISGDASSIIVNTGSLGQELQVDDTVDVVLAELHSVTVNQYQDETPSLPAPDSDTPPLFLDITAATETTSKVLSDEEMRVATERATHFVGRSIAPENPEIKLRLTDQDLLSLLVLPDGYDQEQLAAFISEWKANVDRPAQDAVFEHDPETLQVQTFTPHTDGRSLDAQTTALKIVETMQKIESQSSEEVVVTHSVELPIATTSPELPLSELNDLGINERIGFGDSEYDHSIPNRIHNVSHTANKITNTIVAPGEEFSFNKTLGDVSSLTGFRSAYVIKDGKTILGDGGGVCQASTTLFRALLNAGVDITLRRPHSYRVSYYELNSKPGIDATVYSGDVDLRFINDTDHHILIHAQAFSDDLYMKIELYGTSDGRYTELTDHTTWDARPAPPAEYGVDPSLPSGVTRQIDWAVSGIKASFKNKVYDKDGTLLREDEYFSNYRPWSAKYLVGP